MTKNHAYLFLTVLLVVCVLLLWDSPEKILGIPTTQEQVKVYPYAVARNTNTENYSEDGSLNYRFKARKLEHYRANEEEGDEYTLIKLPSLYFYQNGVPWTVVAEEGKISAQGTRIFLWSQVIISHEDANQETELLTSELEIFPEQDFARTSAQVKITSPYGVTEAQGMEVDLDEKKIKLLSRVRGQYDSL